MKSTLEHLKSRVGLWINRDEFNIYTEQWLEAYFCPKNDMELSKILRDKSTSDLRDLMKRIIKEYEKSTGNKGVVVYD